jgi:hypothetical protein
MLTHYKTTDCIFIFCDRAIAGLSPIPPPAGYPECRNAAFRRLSLALGLIITLDVNHVRNGGRSSHLNLKDGFEHFYSLKCPADCV